MIRGWDCVSVCDLCLCVCVCVCVCFIFFFKVGSDWAMDLD